jgi:predicted RNA-binding Zn ribbon-like protein
MTDSDLHDSSPDRQPPELVGDHVALDFLNSIAAPSGTMVDWIPNGPDFVAWLVGAKVINPDDAQSVLSQFSSRDLNKTARDATALREWFRDVLLQVKTSGIGALSPTDIDRLNAVLAQGATYQHIEDVKDTGLRLTAKRSWQKTDDLLAPVAVAMADLLCNGDFDLVRNCHNAPCTMWFYDRTKGHRRRWCSQAVCGNRAKVAAFRKRQKQNNQ